MSEHEKIEVESLVGDGSSPFRDERIHHLAWFISGTLMYEDSDEPLDFDEAKRAMNWVDDAEVCLHQQADRIEQLEAIVERLPKTADGVPVVPGDIVYDLLGDTRKVDFAPYAQGRRKFWIPTSLRDGRRLPEYQQWITGVLEVEQCYSTPEAAQAAREQEGGG